MSTVSLGHRVAKLEAAEAIRQLKARYAALADAKYAADYQRQPLEQMKHIAWQQAMCFTEDAVWEGGAGFGQSLAGRAQLHDWFQRSPWCFAVHYYSSPELDIDVTSKSASGKWQLWQLALREDNREAVLLAATTHETYAQGADGLWRCAHMKFEQIHLTALGAGADPLAATLAQLDSRRAVASAP